MYHILFDCDPGHDDAMALMLMAAHPEVFHILGITTVAGNQTVDKVTVNALKLTEYLGLTEIPVSVGAEKPLTREAEPQPAAHGESGMDGFDMPEPVKTVTGKHAVDFMRETILAATEPVTILATGPMTNVALLLMTCPEAKEKVDRIAIMGGSVHSGNILPKAEFNIYHDPEAARIVFRSGIPVVMSGLEICSLAEVPFEKYEELAGEGKASDLTVGLLDFFSQYSRVRGWTGTTIFDLTAAMQLLHPEIFTSEKMVMDVETQGDLCRGMTVADFRSDIQAEKNVEVLTGVDQDAYVAYFQEAIRILNRKLG
jgi:pyrimidine-specific ribonucleoside hydrolase